jgi:hypothetical protein
VQPNLAAVTLTWSGGNDGAGPWVVGTQLASKALRATELLCCHGACCCSQPRATLSAGAASLRVPRQCPPGHKPVPPTATSAIGGRSARRRHGTTLLTPARVPGVRTSLHATRLAQAPTSGRCTASHGQLATEGRRALLQTAPSATSLLARAALTITHVPPTALGPGAPGRHAAMNVATARRPACLLSRH